MSSLVDILISLSTWAQNKHVNRFLTWQVVRQPIVERYFMHVYGSDLVKQVLVGIWRLEKDWELVPISIFTRKTLYIWRKTLSAGKWLQIIETPPQTVPHPLVLVVKFGTHLAALIKAIAVQILIIKSSPDPSQKQSNYMLFTILWYAFAFYLPNLLTTPRRDSGEPDNCFNFLHVGRRLEGNKKLLARSTIKNVGQARPSIRLGALA